MKALTKAQVAEQEKLIEKFNELADAVKIKVEAYEEACNDLNGAIDDLNGVISDIHTFADEIATAIDDYYNEKSEAWQESEKGEAYYEWRDLWQEVEHEVSPVEGVVIEDIDIPDIDSFEDRPTEPQI